MWSTVLLAWLITTVALILDPLCWFRLDSQVTIYWIMGETDWSNRVSLQSGNIALDKTKCADLSSRGMTLVEHCPLFIYGNHVQNGEWLIRTLLVILTEECSKELRFRCKPTDTFAVKVSTKDWCTDEDWEAHTLRWLLRRSNVEGCYIILWEHLT